MIKIHKDYCINTVEGIHYLTHSCGFQYAKKWPFCIYGHSYTVNNKSYTDFIYKDTFNCGTKKPSKQLLKKFKFICESL